MSRVLRSADRAFNHTRGEVGRRDAQTAEIDPVLVGSRAAVASKLLMMSFAEVGGVVDDAC